MGHVFVRVFGGAMRVVTGWITWESRYNAFIGDRKHFPCAVLRFPTQCYDPLFERKSS